jgi:hypothetical protein
MSEFFYGIPNTEPFWTGLKTLHYVLVGLAGGMAVLAAILTLRQHPDRNRYLWLAGLFILLDMFVLWAGSSARWYFSQFWLFLSFEPRAPIWWGTWGLSSALAAVALILLKTWVPLLKRIPEMLLGTVMLVGGLVALAYPGIALVVNENRPVWNEMMLVIFPVTALLMVLAVAMLFGSAWARRWEVMAAAVTVALLVAYPLTLQGEAREHFMREGLLVYATAGVLVAVALVLFRNPRLAAGLGLAGAVGLRWMLVQVGQIQAPGL